MRDPMPERKSRMGMMLPILAAMGVGAGLPGRGAFQGALPTDRVEQADGSYVCRICGGTFRSPLKNAKFCSPGCYEIHRAKKKFKGCPGAFRNFIVKRFALTPAELGRKSL